MIVLSIRVTKDPPEVHIDGYPEVPDGEVRVAAKQMLDAGAQVAIAIRPRGAASASQQATRIGASLRDWMVAGKDPKDHPDLRGGTIYKAKE